MFLASIGRRLGRDVGDHSGPAPAPSDSMHCLLFLAPPGPSRLAQWYPFLWFVGSSGFFWASFSAGVLRGTKKPLEPQLSPVPGMGLRQAAHFVPWREFSSQEQSEQIPGVCRLVHPAQTATAAGCNSSTLGSQPTDVLRACWQLRV